MSPYEFTAAEPRNKAKSETSMVKADIPRSSRGKAAWLILRDQIFKVKAQIICYEIVPTLFARQPVGEAQLSSLAEQRESLNMGRSIPILYDDSEGCHQTICG